MFDAIKTTLHVSRCHKSLHTTLSSFSKHLSQSCSDASSWSPKLISQDVCFVALSFAFDSSLQGTNVEFLNHRQQTYVSHWSQAHLVRFLWNGGKKLPHSRPQVSHSPIHPIGPGKASKATRELSSWERVPSLQPHSPILAVCNFSHLLMQSGNHGISP